MAQAIPHASRPKASLKKCGRYASSKSNADLAQEFKAEVAAPKDGEPLEPRPDYNVAPTKQARIVLDRLTAEYGVDKDGKANTPQDKPAGVTDASETDVRRELHLARWGLVPSWAKDLSIGSRMINARAETVAEKPSFRRAFAKRRCIIPADGYFEWYQPDGQAQTTSAKAKKPAKVPFFIHPADGSSLPMAGLYEWWRDPGDGPDAPWVLTYTIITTSSTDALGQIHDRMPMTVPPDRWAQWLHGSPPADLSGWLRPAGDVGLDAYPVSTLVNNVRNNGPELIEPAPAVEGLF